MTTRRIRLRTTSAFDNELRVHELRFYDGDREIARRPDWRLTASRNPWEAGLAFDNDPVTWWTSGQKIDPDTWIEADFPQPVRIDRMGVDQIEDQRWAQLYPSADLNGRWMKLEARETGASTRAGGPSDGAAGSDEGRGHPVDSDPDGDTGAEDLRIKSPYWGITQIGEVYGYRLWKLN